MVEAKDIATDVKNTLTAISVTHSMVWDNALRGKPSPELSKLRALGSMGDHVATIKQRLEIRRRSPEFHEVWDPSAILVLNSIVNTLWKMCQKFKEADVGLKFWKKPVWPLTMDEIHVIEKQLSMYEQMLKLMLHGLSE